VANGKEKKKQKLKETELDLKIINKTSQISLEKKPKIKEGPEL
jgi:hypothetical protein